MPKLLILCGIPYSKMEEFAREHEKEYKVISRDQIRDKMYGKNCAITSYTEYGVEEKFNFELETAYLSCLNVIICNTNCRERYIDEIKTDCPINYDIEVKFFPVSLWKAFFTNYIRFLGGERYIPLRIMKLLKKSYDRINQKKYEIPKNHENSNKLHSDYLNSLLLKEINPN